MVQVFNQSSRQVPIFLKRYRNFYLVSFLKISENHEKFVEKVDFYSSISLAGSGSGFRIQIRIQHGNWNPDPTRSGSETLERMVSFWQIGPVCQAQTIPVYKYHQVKNKISLYTTLQSQGKIRIWQKKCRKIMRIRISKRRIR